MNILTCEKVLYLLPLYIDGKVKDSQAYDIEQHISVCDDCFEKYINLKNISEKIKLAFENIQGSQNENLQKKFFNENISAYIDNELEKEEYFSFNRYISINPKEEKKLENMMFFDEQLKKYLKKYKKNSNKDLSKKVIEIIKQEKSSYLYNLYIKALTLTILFITLMIAADYFSFPEKINSIAIKTSFFNNFSH